MAARKPPRSRGHPAGLGDMGNIEARTPSIWRAHEAMCAGTVRMRGDTMSTVELDLITSIILAFLLITHLLIFVAEGEDVDGSLRKVPIDQLPASATG